MEKENEKPNTRTPSPPSSSKNRELTIYLKSGDSFTLLFDVVEYEHLRQNYNDHFKEVNDTYGHMTGDVVLRECARRINAVTRIYDSFGKFGGEEFLIVIPGAEEKEVFSMCERIHVI